MSLAIDVDDILAVLLPDGWHEVEQGSDGKSTFLFDAYEVVYSGRQWWSPKGESVGFEFSEAGKPEVMCGPMSSVLAIKRRR